MENIYILLIIIIVAITAVILIIKFLKKLIKIIALTVVIIVIAILLIYTSGVLNLDSVNINNVKYNFSVHDLKDKYCFEDMNFRDSIKCVVIITPIYDDILKNYSKNELDEMQWNKFKMSVAIKKAIKNKKSGIHEELKKINALYLWNDFNMDFSSGNIMKKNE